MLWITAMQDSAPPQAGKKKMVSKNIAEEMYSVCTMFQGISCIVGVWCGLRDFVSRNLSGLINKKPLKLGIDNILWRINLYFIILVYSGRKHCNFRPSYWNTFPVTTQFLFCRTTASSILDVFNHNTHTQICLCGYSTQHLICKHSMKQTIFLPSIQTSITHIPYSKS